MATLEEEKEVLMCSQSVREEEEEEEEEVERIPEKASLVGWSWLPFHKERQTSESSLSSVYVCCGSVCADEDTFRCYKIDFTEEGCQLSGALPNLPHRGSTCFTCVGLGSRIYALGGYTNHPRRPLFRNEVFYFDTDSPDEGWKSGPPMLVGRTSPCAFPIDGKILVFSGIYHFMNLFDPPFAEVLDPATDEWVALPSPPPPPVRNWFNGAVPVHALLSDARGHRHLLVHPHTFRDDGARARVLYSYNLDTSSWSTFDPHFGVQMIEPSVALDGILYWFSDGEIYAYDLLIRRRFIHPVRGFEHVLPNDVLSPYLFHIGARYLCLLWMRRVAGTVPCKIDIHCVVFTVDKNYPEDDEPVLCAHIKYISHACELGAYIVSCLTL